MLLYFLFVTAALCFTVLVSYLIIEAIGKLIDYINNK